MSEQRIEIVAQALWADRAKELRHWQKMGWERFCEEKPDLAALYRETALIAVRALDKATEPA